MTPTSLSSIPAVVVEFRHYVCLGCPGTLAQQIAREAVFGYEVMKQRTPLGSREYKALPQSGIWKVKCAIFAEYFQFWDSPEGFEET